jgi:prolyl-tRNA synthetase
VWATSWGVSTRLIGALIMTHSDDRGLVLPPKMAQRPVVIVPIWKGDETREQVKAYANALYEELRGSVAVILDDREQYKPGYKFADWELQGIPIRLEVGPKDIEKNNVVLVRRDTMEKTFVSRDDAVTRVLEELDTMQREMLERARLFREENTFDIDSYEAFIKLYEGEGGFARSHWCGDAACEQKVKEDTKATIRCIPFEQEKEEGSCIVCGNVSQGRVIFSKAY